MAELNNPPRWATWLFNHLVSRPDFHSLIDDLEIEYADRASDKGCFIASMWYFRQGLCALFDSCLISLQLKAALFFYYFQTAFRHLKRQKGFSFINIFGLTMGLAACIFILLFLRYELSYDSHHQDTDRIYRIVQSTVAPTFNNTYSGISPPSAGLIKDVFPQIEQITWTWSHNIDSQVEVGNHIFKEESRHVMYADDDFLKIFSVNFRFGNPETALIEPNSVIITTEIARKYFGNENALNQSIKIDSVACCVTGVIDAPPGNSIFQHRIIQSWRIIEDPTPSRQSGGFGGFYQTFVKIHPGINKTAFEQQIKNIVVEQNHDYLEQIHADVVVTLQPLRDIHFSPDLQFDLPAQGSMMYLYLFAGIALLILIITSINFVNLSTARATNRAAEVGIRKTVGARRRQLIGQFMGESFLTVTISFLLALTLVNCLIPQFNAITSLQVAYGSLFKIDVLLALVMLFLVEGFIAGIYPAFLLSSYKPASVLKGQMKSGTKSKNLRSMLIFVQFSISIVLIVVSIIFNMQLHYMKTQPLGFDIEQMLIVDFQRQNYQYDPLLVKNEFLKHHTVMGASFSSTVPGRWLYPWSIWPSGQRDTNSRPIHVMGADSDFMSLYQIDALAGMTFTINSGKSERSRSWIFNEKAAQIFGWDTPEEALNQFFMDDDMWQVIGVMKDFHFTGLQTLIGPVGIFHTSKGAYLSLKIKTENVSETLAFIAQTYQSLFPDKYFEYFFLDDDFNRHYLKEEQMKRIFNIFTILGIIIACLGLLGLSAFITQQRTKEIGVRKILGASVITIVTLLTGQFVKWVALSNMIAWPVAYFLIQNILSHFAYRVKLGIFPFLITGIVTIVVAILTVGYQAFTAATTQPIKSVKCD
ncbi:ABC transporter permease [bacterium]|nr:ABC transporter permease [bacterium]